ncbi:MAG: hypothetical protein IRY85_03025 [Micromonosporaceae bacterium]|nr:hypothetical protein [Micromonosporaceae bacterium]
MAPDDQASTSAGRDGLGVLRTIWAADERAVAEFDEECAPAKVCRNMRDFTFDGMAEPGTDLSTAWRERLRREGKLGTGGGSIRDLVLGPREQS